MSNPLDELMQGIDLAAIMEQAQGGLMEQAAALTECRLALAAGLDAKDPEGWAKLCDAYVRVSIRVLGESTEQLFAGVAPTSDGDDIEAQMHRLLGD